MTDIMSVSNRTEVQLGLETDMRKFCESHINQKVTLQGYLSHAILAHHHAPFLMSVQSVYVIEEPSRKKIGKRNDLKLNAVFESKTIRRYILTKSKKMKVESEKNDKM